MKDGFIKIAAATPEIKVADCASNAARIIEIMRDAEMRGVQLVVFPELCLSGYTCGDLFLQTRLRTAAHDALCGIVAESGRLGLIAVVGLPYVHEGRLYNCAAVIYGGRLLGLVPKTNLPNYGEFYELRYFSPAPAEVGYTIFNGERVPFGADILFRCADMPEFCFAAEICEDLWVPVPPSCAHASAGATIILNLSASDETVGKADYRRLLVRGQSGRLVCGYVYADAGSGESSTDMVFAGQNMIAENGAILAESELFTTGMTLSEIDVSRLASERIRNVSSVSAPYREHITVDFRMQPYENTLTRIIDPQPFVPADAGDRSERCSLILELQARGLAQRLVRANASGVVIGVSGGLDSTLAMIVSARAMDILGRPRSDITAVTMPCFGTTSRTRSNAEILSELIGANFREVDIRASVEQHFKDIGQNPESTDVTYENAQARERTQVIMDIANMTGSLVVGTGDLSELALGWATYNGDHMSMYGVNASVPKTLVRYIVETAADTSDSPEYAAVLRDILATPVSPELLPSDGDDIAQRTEELVGPYELHDFFLFNAIRLGFSPAKIFRLALRAFEGKYDRDVILKWLRSFYRRFFAQQFKRSCLPDGPKVGTLTLSPRSDFRMPSDATAAAWLDELETL